MNVKKSFIRFSGVSKWFDTPAGRFHALREIDFEIGQGEYVAIVGKSGSGKSTLLNMLTGIDHPARGTVSFHDTEIHALSEARLAAWRGANVGIVFQFFQLIPTLTIMENLMLAMDFVNVIPENERLKRGERLLAQVGILEHAGKLPSGLSGGQQQRAAIARALANDPPTLVADEPTGNLDSQTARAVQDIFSQLARDGKTVIVVTHEHVAKTEYDRVIELADGSVLKDERTSHEH